MLKGQNIIVIGGKGLIGDSIVKSLNENDANVIIADFSIKENSSEYFIDINSEKSVDEFIQTVSQIQSELKMSIN